MFFLGLALEKRHWQGQLFRAKGGKTYVFAMEMVSLDSRDFGE